MSLNLQKSHKALDVAVHTYNSCIDKVEAGESLVLTEQPICSNCSRPDSVGDPLSQNNKMGGVTEKETWHQHLAPNACVQESMYIHRHKCKDMNTYMHTYCACTNTQGREGRRERERRREILTE